MKLKLIYSLVGLSLLAGACQSPKVYLVRHAEKATQPANDPDLTEVGKQRAMDLADLLGHRRIQAIYATNYRRTRETAVPLAKTEHLEILIYTPDTANRIVEQALKWKSNTLIVGHSNTLLPLLKNLGLKPTLQEIKDSDYDNLFIVYRKKGILQLKEKTYGKQTAAGEVSMK